MSRKAEKYSKRGIASNIVCVENISLQSEVLLAFNEGYGKWYCKEEYIEKSSFIGGANYEQIFNFKEKT